MLDGDPHRTVRQLRKYRLHDPKRLKRLTWRALKKCEKTHTDLDFRPHVEKRGLAE
jgi:hypothetical protein